LRRGARRQLLAVTARDTPPDLHVHQAVMAELLTEYGEDLAHEDEEDRRLLSTILATVAVGSAVIRLKRGLREADIPAPLRPMIRDALGDLGRRLRRRDGAPDRMLAHLAEGRAAASAWLKREHLGTAERLATLRALLSLTTIDDGICRHPELFGAAAAGGAPFVQFGRGQDAA
jgi:hypothetical protein